MAILKHIASKRSNYGAALEYLIFKHDEFRKDSATGLSLQKENERADEGLGNRGQHP